MKVGFTPSFSQITPPSFKKKWSYFIEYTSENITIITYKFVLLLIKSGITYGSICWLSDFLIDTYIKTYNAKNTANDIFDVIIIGPIGWIIAMILWLKVLSKKTQKSLRGDAVRSQQTDQPILLNEGEKIVVDVKILGVFLKEAEISYLKLLTLSQELDLDTNGNYIKEVNGLELEFSFNESQEAIIKIKKTEKLKTEAKIYRDRLAPKVKDLDMKKVDLEKQLKQQKSDKKAKRKDASIKARKDLQDKMDKTAYSMGSDTSPTIASGNINTESNTPITLKSMASSNNIDLNKRGKAVRKAADDFTLTNSYTYTPHNEDFPEGLTISVAALTEVYYKVQAKQKELGVENTVSKKSGLNTKL